MKRLYIVGLGPGDPELITIKGLKKLEEAEVIFVPIGSGMDEGMASSVVEKLSLGTKMVKLYIDMGDRDCIQKKAEEICRALLHHNSVAIAVLGEPSLYSTSARLLLSMGCLEGVATEVVPGVSAIYACADRVPIHLALGDDAIAVVPSGRVEAIGDDLANFDTIIVVKGGKNMARAAGFLASRGYRILYARRCFTDGETIGGSFLGEDYMSLIIAKR